MYVSSPPASLTSKALFAMFFSLSLRGLDGLHHLLFCNRSRMQPRGLASFWSPVVCESWSATYEASSSCVFYGSLILPHLKIEAARPRYKQERLRIGLSHLIFCIALWYGAFISFIFLSRCKLAKKPTGHTYSCRRPWTWRFSFSIEAFIKMKLCEFCIAKIKLQFLLSYSLSFNFYCFTYVGTAHFKPSRASLFLHLIEVSSCTPLALYHFKCVVTYFQIEFNTNQRGGRHIHVYESYRY